MVSNAKLDISTDIYLNNNSTYGADIASYPKEISITFVTSNDYLNNSEQKRNLNQ